MNNACKTCPNIFEVFRTENGCVYQCDRTSKFLLEFAGHQTSFNALHFLSLKRKVDQIDLADAILSTTSDITIINACGSERVFALSIYQLIEFKELLAGTKAMLELNSIVRERIYNPVL